MKKLAMKVLPIMIIIVIFVMPTVFGEISTGIPTGGNSSSTAKQLVLNIWETVALVVQVLAIAAVVFAGIRYMFASADAKADIKKQTVTLVVGAILVFGATTIVQIISKIVTESKASIPLV